MSKAEAWLPPTLSTETATKSEIITECGEATWSVLISAAGSMVDGTLVEDLIESVDSLGELADWVEVRCAR